MASNYNRRPMPAEVHGARTAPGTVIRRRQTIDDLRGARSMTRRTSPGCSSPSKGSTRAASRRRPSCCATDFSDAGSACRLLVVPGLRHPDRRRDRPRRCTASATTAADVMQLLYVANRYERKPRSCTLRSKTAWRSCLRPLRRVEHRLRRGAGARRRAGSRTSSASCRRPISDHPARHRARDRGGAQGAGRDRYERDLALLARVRDSYHRQAAVRPLAAARRRSSARRGRRRRRSAPSRHDSRRRKRPHLARAGRAQHPRARLQRRAGGRTSSTSRTTRPLTVARGAAARTRRARCAWRWAAGRSVCDGVRRVRRSAFCHGFPERARQRPPPD